MAAARPWGCTSLPAVAGAAAAAALLPLTTMPAAVDLITTLGRAAAAGIQSGYY